MSALPSNTPLSDPVVLRKVMAMIELAAKQAREAPAPFFNFVMRDEKGQRVQIAPHQDIALDFIMKHQRSVNIWPIGHSKTYLTAALTLWLLGREPMTRGAIISATQEQAAKPLGMVSDYLINSHELRVVFPHLRPSTNKRDPWTQTAITVDRPRGIRDASLRAIGLDGAILGSRLDWIIIDDILSRENTATQDQRKKLIEWVDTSVFSRIEPGPDARVVVMNTPWHPEDLVHVLEQRGWACMRMSALGDIVVQDDRDLIREARENGRVYETWDHDGVRWRDKRKKHELTDPLRLVAHDPDPLNIKPLWPERFPPAELERRRRRTVAPEWNRNYLCIARSDDEAMCKQEYIEACKVAARKAGVFGLVHEWKQGHLVFTGVDLAIKEGEHHDLTAFFTFAVLPSGHRQILDIETGRFQGPIIVKKIIDKVKRYGSVVIVENNGAQDYLRQFVLKEDASIPIRAHTTTSRKAHPEYGVASVFVEMANGAWLVPNTTHGDMHPEVEKFCNYCLNYVPEKHTADVLMAQYFARELAREWGVLSGGDLADEMGKAGGSLAASLMVR